VCGLAFLDCLAVLSRMYPVVPAVRMRRAWLGWMLARPASGWMVGVGRPMGCLLVLARSARRDVGRRRADHVMGEILDRAGQHVRVGGSAAQSDHHEKPAGQLKRTSGAPPGGVAARQLPVGWFAPGGRDAGPSNGATERSHRDNLAGHLARARRAAQAGESFRQREQAPRSFRGQRLSVEDHVQPWLVRIATGPTGEGESRHLA
jgi:hypothetical protein